MINFFSVRRQYFFSGKVKRHNVQIWRTENTIAHVQQVSDSKKLNVFSVTLKI